MRGFKPLVPGGSNNNQAEAYLLPKQAITVKKLITRQREIMLSFAVTVALALVPSQPYCGVRTGARTAVSVSPVMMADKPKQGFGDFINKPAGKQSTINIVHCDLGLPDSVCGRSRVLARLSARAGWVCSRTSMLPPPSLRI